MGFRPQTRLYNSDIFAPNDVDLGYFKLGFLLDQII